MATQTARQRTTSHHPFFSRRKVLLVDDDVRDLEYYRNILEQKGYEVRTCAAYDQGARCLDSETIDFVVVSQGSGAFEGRRLLEHVVGINRRLPVLVLARCVDMNCYLEAMQLGAVDYLEKPLSREEILRVVETHIRPGTTAA